jgi:hypothetical protein
MRSCRSSASDQAGPSVSRTAPGTVRTLSRNADPSGAGLTMGNGAYFSPIALQKDRAMADCIPYPFLPMSSKRQYRWQEVRPAGTKKPSVNS